MFVVKGMDCAQESKVSTQKDDEGMILVDTSVWVQVLRDSQGKVVRAFRERLGEEICVLSCRIL